MSETQKPEPPDEFTYALDPVDGEPVEGVDEEPDRPNKASLAVSQPLPRLWKAEPDPSAAPEGTDPDRSAKKIAKGGSEDVPTPSKASKPKAKPNPPKAKPKPKSTAEGDENDKKVLVEETPTFDTVEARQRARLIVGGLGVFCVMLACYIGYRILFGGSSEFDIPSADPAMAQAPPPAVPPPLEPEARYMLKKAQEFAKGGRTDQAVGMLKRIVASYKGTQSAVEARAALERPQRSLPLFPDGPALLAEQKRLEALPAQGALPNMNPRRPPAATEPIAMGPPSVDMGPAQSRTQRAQPQPFQPRPAQVQPAQPRPAQVQPAQPQPVQIQPAQPQPVVQSQPAQPAPAQSIPPTGPGQVAMIVPAERRDSDEMPKAVEKPDAGRADNPARTLTQRELPPGFKAKIEAGRHESGWPWIIVGDRDGGPMVLVPGGTFTMGSDKSEAAEAPAHTVRLSTFYIDQYEVTIRQFRIFLDETHYHGLPPGKWLTDAKLRDAPAGTPAVYVNWRDAETFAIWAGKRLPTEAQWEMAARSNDGRRYPWGDRPVKWSRPRGFRQVDPVMSFQEDVSAFGVFDMAGNVMEWTRDWYDPTYFVKFKDKIAENPTGPATHRQNSIQRVVKGVSKNWTVSSRQGVDLDKRLPYLGFRCTVAVEGPEASAGIAPHPVKPEAQPGAPPPGNGAAAGTVPF